MKTTMRRLALMAVIAGVGVYSSAAYAETGVVGDLPGFGEDAYFHADGVYGVEKDIAEAEAKAKAAIEKKAQPAQPIQPVSHAQADFVAGPVEGTVGDVEPVHHETSCTSCGPIDASCGCEVTCDTGSDCCGEVSCGVEASCSLEASCGVEPACGCDSGHGKLMNLFDRGGRDRWLKAEALLWFPEARDSPPLVIRSDAGTIPSAPDDRDVPVAGFQTLFGDELAGELSGGVRVDSGVWLTDNFGIGGRFWWLGDNEESLSATGDGSTGSLGYSFFDSDDGEEDAVVIAIDLAVGAADPDRAGTITADTSLDMWAAEAYGRMRFTCSKNCQLNLLGGYSHINVDDSLRINGTTTVTAANASGATIGTNFTFNDIFETENEFNGGQIGFESVISRGRWLATSLTKVHIGNLNSTLTQRGDRTVSVPGGATLSEASGVLAGEAITLERDEFTFVPEANFKLAYLLRPGVSVSVGYSFLYFDDVTLAANSIDRIVDDAVITAAAANLNGWDFNRDGLFVHGIDLGAVVQF
ncbi:MAG: BBP7 family outer membrane beta-barrel protein [Planctomycetota bacterium]